MTKHQFSVTKRIPFGAANSPNYYTLNSGPGQLLMAIYVFLRGNIVFTGGTTSGTSQGENPGLLVQKVEFDAIPKGDSKYSGGKLVNSTARSLMRRRVFDRGLYVNDQNNVAGIAGAAATYTLNLCLPVPFALPNILKGAETALKIDEFNQLLLTITNGAATTMLSGNDRTVDYSALYYEIVEIREFNPGFFPVGTLYNDDKPIAITAANTRFSIDNQLSQRESYVDAMFCAETTNQALSDSIINRVTVFSGTEQFLDLYNSNIKFAQTEYTKDLATSFTGLYYIPFVQGMAENAGLLNGTVNNPGITLDVSNPGTDRLLLSTRRVFPRAA